MKLRQAKKILCSLSKKRDKRFKELRPDYYDEKYGLVSPSWHDIDIVARANTRMRHYFKRMTRRLLWQKRKKQNERMA